MNIDLKELRVGDKVRMTVAREGVVSEIDDEGYVSFGGWRFFGDATDLGPHLPVTLAWELLDRPKPARKLGSLWVDPQDSRRWVALEGGSYITPDGQTYITPVFNDGTIDRLVPAEGDA